MAGPAVIADAYDLYADQLYAYCRFLVRDPADALDALENTFLVASGRGASLPLDGQMRTWLFAVARNECLRSIGSRRTMPGPAPGSRPGVFPGSPPGDPADGYADRALLGAAVEGLAPGDRDLIAMLWHGLDADDTATVLGISREETFPLLDRALVQLEMATSALLVARAGRNGCADLAALLRGWDGRLNVSLARDVTQHTERCRVCSARRQDELRPALLLGLTPAALLGAGVSAEALRPAAATVGELRDQVLSLVCDPSGPGAEARARACGQAGPFDGQDSVPPSAGHPGPLRVGFPVPLPAEPGRRGQRTRLAAALTGAAAAAVAVTAALAAGAQAPARDSALTGLNRHPASAVTMTAAAVPAVSPSSAFPTRTVSAVASASPSPSPSSSPSRSATPAPSRTASPRASARPAPTISVPSSVTLRWNRSQGQLEGTLQVTVKGGQVSWSISNPNPGLQLSQTSGTTSASVLISGRYRSPQPLTVTAGGVSTTVTLTTGY